MLNRRTPQLVLLLLLLRGWLTTGQTDRRTDRQTVIAPMHYAYRNIGAVCVLIIIAFRFGDSRIYLFIYLLCNRTHGTTK